MCSINVLVQKIVRRSLAKDELVLTVDPVGSGFRGTLSIACLPEDWPTRSWRGSLIQTCEKAAKTEVVKIALEELTDQYAEFQKRKPTAAPAEEPCGKKIRLTSAVIAGIEFQENPKVVLNMVLQRLIDKPLVKHDIKYNGATLSIPCLPDEWPVRTWTSDTGHANQREAQDTVAIAAMEELSMDQRFLDALQLVKQGKTRKIRCTPFECKRVPLSEDAVTGIVHFLEPHNKSGQIKPDVPIECEELPDSDGNLYFTIAEFPAGAAEVAVGTPVRFKAYRNALGLGAQDISLL